MSTAGQGSPGRACPGPESSLLASQPGGCLAWLVEATRHVSGLTFAEQFPSFINEHWQQPCELGLSGRGSARLGRPGPWLPGLSICSVLLLPAGHPERLCTQSEVRAFGGRRQLLTPTPGAGLGRAGQGRAGAHLSIPLPIATHTQAAGHILSFEYKSLSWSGPA